MCRRRLVHIHNTHPYLHYTTLHYIYRCCCAPFGVVVASRCCCCCLVLLLFACCLSTTSRRALALFLAHTLLRSRSHSRIQCRMTAKNVFRIFSFSCLISLLCFYFSFDIYTHTHTHAHRSMGRDKLLHLA